jgi:hypothetical protein
MEEYKTVSYTQDIKILQAITENTAPASFRVYHEN